jgi:glutamate/tyrosine decarboxylase-like PLP-dependent enzyme
MTTTRPASPHAAALARAAELAQDYLAGVADRPVARPTDPAGLREALGGPLPDGPSDAAEVVDTLAQAAEPGLVASAGPRYFGFVTGANLPATVGAEWLANAWDQNGAFYVMSPAASVAEEVAAGWLLELLGLSNDMSVGFATGATMANVTGVAAARHALLARSGWDAEEDGLYGAPPIHVLVGAEVHSSAMYALRLVGFGSARATRVAVDDQGAMSPEALRAALDDLPPGPILVLAQAGNVNSGAFDPLEPIADAVAERDGWLHVDAAFGLWAAASPKHRHRIQGLGRAHSIATDAHKWLNVPYDSGIAFVADPVAHRAAMSQTAAYLVAAEGVARDGIDWVPDSSRHARGFAMWAALRSLGRSGVADLVDRCCTLARRMAERLAAEPGIEILNDVVLNQVVVRFAAAGEETAAGDARTRAVIAAVQRDGTCWAGGTTWRGQAGMRISVSAWNTTEDDIERSADAIIRCAEQVAGSQ